MSSRSWKWWPLTAICLGTVMLLVDVTIVNVALPDMAIDLGTTFSSLQWVVDIYALAVAAVLLGAGAVADRLGHRRIYVAGLLGFAVASAVCGFAPSPGLLIAARGVQGLAGAAMFATTFALLNSSYQGRDRGAAYGVWGAISGAASALGPIAGGLLTEHLSWRWIFFVNLPVCAAALVMTARALLPDQRSDERRRVDVTGVLAFTVAVGSLTYGLIRAGEVGWTTASTVGLFALAAAAAVAFVAVEARVAEPVLDLALLRRPTFVGALVAALVLSFSAFAYLAYASLWLQSVLALSPIQAGLVTLPLSGGAFLMSGLVSKRLHGIDPGRVIGGGLLVIAAGALAQAFLDEHSSWPALLPGLFVIGLGVGIVAPVLSSTAMSVVPANRGGMAAGTVNTARQLGFAVGIAVLGSIFSAHLGGRGAGSVLAREHVDAAIRAATAAGLDGALFTAAGVALVAGLLVVRLMSTRKGAPVTDCAHGAVEAARVAR
jgi:EmrB/QacA subfamily drug resistance transporter